MPTQPPIFDGHNDTILHIYFLEDGDDWSFNERNDTGHIDLPRAREGGMFGGFFAIVAPHVGDEDDKLSRGGLVRTDEGYSIPMAPAMPADQVRKYTEEALEIFESLEADSEGQFFFAHSFEQVLAARDDGRLAALLHFEGAEAIDEDLEALYQYYERGLRSVGIVWSRPNIFGHGVPFKFPSSPDTGPGLTDAGRRLVKACNDLGVVVDLAHLNEAGFWDIEAITDKPLVVSHACCHAICPSARNLTDRQIDAIGATNGLIGINFFVGDLRDDGQFIADTPLDRIVDHIDYVVDRIGVDHVAFGSDFDGARMPTELADVAGLPRLIDALRRRGYDQGEVEKIANENWMRILEVTIE